MHVFAVRALRGAPLLLCALALPGPARAADDACALLTPAEVGSAVGAAVGAGTHVTPTFLRTCTWKAQGASNVESVTLYLQTVAAYDGGRRMASQMAGSGRAAAFTPIAIGDDGYYFVVGDQAGLLVKKGAVSFKVAVYARLPVDQKEAMERKLADAVLARL